MKRYRLRYHRSDWAARAIWHVAYKPAWLRAEIAAFRAKLDSMPIVDLDGTVIR